MIKKAKKKNSPRSLKLSTNQSFVIFITLTIWAVGIFFLVNYIVNSQNLDKPDDGEISELQNDYNVQTENEEFKNRWLPPGENGEPFHFDENTLINPVDKLAYREAWRSYQFNNYVSNLISIERNLPDIRDAECLDIKYAENLPSTSVIIIFYNEAVSVLLRTVYSVLNRSNPELLKEVILVDDSSDFSKLTKKTLELIDNSNQQILFKGELGEVFEEYVKTLCKVKIIRAEKRSGLIKARILGAVEATGDVLVFLDSHCEVTEGWLEPLLDPITRNPNVSTVPIVEIIDYETFELGNLGIEGLQAGGFDWDLNFAWNPIPHHEQERRKRKIDPFRSPTMPG